MPADETRLNRMDGAAIGVLVLAALGIRLFFLQFYDVISADGISYVTIAQDFISGRGLAAATHYPPFFPILLGLAAKVFPTFETAGLAVSVVMGSLLALPVYLLGREFFDRRVGFMAAALSITWPTLRYWSTAVMSQATYITLLLLGVYLLWQGYQRSSLFQSVLAGTFFACAHLTRSEGALVLIAQLAVLVLFTLTRQQPPRRLLYPALSLAVFAMVFSPYCWMLHDLTGKWQLTGKSKITIADALSEYLGRPDLKHDPAFQEIGYLDLFRIYPDYIRTNYLKNLAACWREMLPWYGWLLAALGLVLGGTRRDTLWQRLFLLGTFLPLVVIIVFFFIGPEYTQPYLPVLFLGVGNALSYVVGWLRANRVSHWGGRAAACTPLCLILCYGGWSVAKEVPADRDRPYITLGTDDKHIGLKLGETLPADAVIITRSGRIGFYSNRRYLIPPQTDFSGIVEFARKNKATHLIATEQLLNQRPQLEPLYGPLLHPAQPFTPPPDLELVSISQEPGGLPYLVYRFK